MGSQLAILIVELSQKERLNRLSGALVQHLTLSDEQRIVGHFRERVWKA
jgi:hypothetical protein